MADDGIKYGINNWFDDNNEIAIKFLSNET